MQVLTTSLLGFLMALIAWQQCMPGCLQQSSILNMCKYSTVPRLLSRLGHITPSIQQQQQQRTYVLGSNGFVRSSAPVRAGQHTGPGSDNDSSDAGKQPSKGKMQRAGLFQTFFWRLVLLLRVSATLVLLVAAMPYLISSRLGTAVVAAGASRVLPGDVQIQRVSLGWTQPLAVEGLSVFEGAAGSSRQLLGLQRLSSAGAPEGM
jgi:hypothetical protein